MDRTRHTDSAPKTVWIPIRVIEDDCGTPSQLKLNGNWALVKSVESVEDVRQNMVTGEQVVKTHYQLIMTDLAQLTVFKNHVTGGWYGVG